MKGQGGQNNTQRAATTMKNKVRLGIAHKNSGYTVTEVMVFLAVSAAIFFMMAGAFSQQQRNSQFTTAAREMESRISDIANDISSGYYSYPDGFRCIVSSGVPQKDSSSPAGAGQGRSSECILLGRVVHLKTSDDRQFITYTVAGARTKDGADVTNYTDANPRTFDQLIETLRVPPGVTIKKMYIGDDPTDAVNAIGFIANLSDSGGNATSITVNTVTFSGSDDDSVRVAINDTSSYNTARLNPAGGVTVCMEGEGTSQYALLRVGDQSSRLATDLEIRGGSCDDV